MCMYLLYIFIYLSLSNIYIQNNCKIQTHQCYIFGFSILSFFFKFQFNFSEKLYWVLYFLTKHIPILVTEHFSVRKETLSQIFALS